MYSLEPGGPPENITSFALNSTSISISVYPPKHNVVYGIINRYKIDLRNTENEVMHHIHEKIDKSMQTSIIITGLRKYKEIFFSIQAGTKVGFGPTSVKYRVKTLEDGRWL